MSTPVWITATPPAPHGELHVGHLAGPYVAADVLSRYLRAEGEPVLFTTGTADHSSSVHVRALRAGRKPEEVAEGFREAITADWLRSGIEFDRIVRPRQDAHYGRRMAELFQPAPRGGRHRRPHAPDAVLRTVRALAVRGARDGFVSALRGAE